MEQADDIRSWLRATGRAGGLPTGAFPRAGDRVRAGEDVLFVLRELLDELALWDQTRGREALARLVAEPAPLSGDARADALLAGLAEHLAVTRDLEAPAWSREPARFLTVWWFPHRRRGFDALALRDAPAAFRRRGVMLHPSMLERC